ncbi:hypothetical protein [Actinomadura macrotermitis]|uniref:Secreted protein n=1 Tax=Actinomadura macrotermitis TaxID=2585200 RepID=A0A7K0C1F8_9ACTN|nr:hypothetical protein [Actinomadura macrotermitis]MQY07277.1 hypothetical protein [Actinomadura macrotermitis]
MAPLLARAAAAASAALALIAAAPAAHAAPEPFRVVPLPFLWPRAYVGSTAADSPTSVWVSGKQGMYCVPVGLSCALSSDGNPVVRRWTGSAWKEYPLDGWTGQGGITQVRTGTGGTWIANATGRYLARFDGARFTPVPAPDAGAIAVLSSGPAGTWAVTTSLYHRDGDGWTPAAVPANLRHIADVKARTATDAWAVGVQKWADSSTLEPDVPAIAHFDGTSWQAVPNPAQAPASRERFLKVSPTGANAMWAITTRSLAGWDGSSWTVVPAPPGVVRFTDLATGADGSPWAIGVPANGVGALYHYTGGAWTNAALPVMGVTSLTAVPGGDAVWATAYQGDDPRVITGSG